jgi:hypothetical protein
MTVQYWHHFTFDDRSFSPQRPPSGAETPFKCAQRLVTTSASSTMWFCPSVTRRKWSRFNPIQWLGCCCLFILRALNPSENITGRRNHHCWFHLTIHVRMPSPRLGSSLRGRFNWLFVWIGQKLWHITSCANVGSETWHFKSAPLTEWWQRTDRWGFLAL